MEVWPTRCLLVAALVLLAGTLARAEQEGEQACSTPAVHAARKAFQRLYNATDYARARTVLAPVWEACFQGDPQGVLAAAVASDLAVAQYRDGDGDACLETLQDYSAGEPTHDKRLAALPAALRKALAFNLAQCRTICSSMSASCVSSRVDRAVQKLAKGDFQKRPCLFQTGTEAIAVPGAADRCLRVLPARRARDADALTALADPLTADGAPFCPRLEVVSRGAHGLNHHEVTLPRGSWLRSLETCCAAIEVTTDLQGRIRLAPDENPPEGCVTGHRTRVVEEIYGLEGVSFRLKHKVHKGVY